MILEQIRNRAAADIQHIVLPEGDDPRTIEAAAMCARDRIAKITIIGNEEGIRTIATETGSPIAQIKAVGKEGKGNVEAAKAWQELVRQGPDVLPDVLAGLDDASPLVGRSLCDECLEPEICRAAFERACHSGLVENVELHLRGRTALLSLRFITAPSNGIAGSLRDVTDWKAKLDALHESDAYFRTMAMTMTEGALLIRADGKYLAVAEPADFVHIYDASTGLYEDKQSIEFIGETAGVSFDPTGDTLFIGNADDLVGSIYEFTRVRGKEASQSWQDFVL